MLTPVLVREAVHAIMLQELTKMVHETAVILKGGVNLRLFFGSPRYSEDMDLDGDPSASMVIRETIVGLFENRGFLTKLRQVGIRELDPGEGPNKDTETTFRYKFGVVTGGIRYGTKVEVSYREPSEPDQVAVEPADVTVVEPYLGPGAELVIPHYKRDSAVRQKIIALGGRANVQARDVFDLHVLAPSEEEGSKLIGFLADSIESSKLREAHERAFEISYNAYRGQVMEFLSDDLRDRFDSHETWDELRLRAVHLIDRAIKRQERQGR